MTDIKHITIPFALTETGECFNCIARLKDDICRLKGIIRVEKADDPCKILIEFDPNLTSLELIEGYAARQGLKLKSHYGHELYTIEDLDCPDCALKLEQSISKIPGVTWVSLNYTTSNIWFEYESGEVTREHILSAIEKAGYTYNEPEVSAVSTHLSHSSFILRGLDCPDCALKLQKKISKLDGVHEAIVNFSTSKMTVKHETSKTNRSDIMASVDESGYQVVVSEEKTTATSNLFLFKNRKLLSTALSGFFIILALTTHLLKGFIPFYSFSIGEYNLTLSHLIYIIAILSGGYYVGKSGCYSLLAKTFDMNFLMCLAVIGALAIGEFEEGAIVVFLFSLGNTLQSYTMDKARHAIRLLMDLSPKEAHLKKGGRLIKVSVSELKIGDIIIVKPGEKVSIDGTIIKGSSPVDESSITGESKPADKLPGDKVFAGSINGSGPLEIKTEKLAQDSTLSRIIHMVEEAQAQKAPSQNFVDSFSKIYTPLVIISAVLISVIPPLFLSLSFAEWFYRGLMLMVISCPCALVISTPVSIVSAIACASKHGILIKGGAYLEEMGSVNVIAFDKTGTLTRSQFEVTDIVGLEGSSRNDVLGIAASLEINSEHPLAKAILKKAGEENIPLKEPVDFSSVPGKGLKGTLNGQWAYTGNRTFFADHAIKTFIYEKEIERLENEGKTTILITCNSIKGIISLADTPRPEAQSCIEELKEKGIKHIVMLTGDNERVAAAVSKNLKIDSFQAALLPEEKVEAVKKFISKYHKVAMVGDGVNDAPALAVSTVGIAMGAASTDIALETADVALMSDDLLKLPFLVYLSRKTLSTIKTNIGFSLIVKGAFITLVFLGMANLWLAVAADSGTSLLVTLYGMRLLVTGKKKSRVNKSTEPATHKKQTAVLCGCGENHNHHDDEKQTAVPCGCGENHNHHDDEKHR
jgi:Zn2+/Cd2+-exporting ATPase